MPSTMPIPARRIGTFDFVTLTGVSISISSKGMSRVISKAISVATSSTSSRNSFVPVFFSLMYVSLC
ncbi:Uncharacterised protein [Mycobacteroides abscessus subsp. abscessus]|nr:Uncharacterised protein [Mycobacteroides abscessus subsp. abscessus]